MHLAKQCYIIPPALWMVTIIHTANCGMTCGTIKPVKLQDL